jgi:hypothetical protein
MPALCQRPATPPRRAEQRRRTGTVQSGQPRSPAAPGQRQLARLGAQVRGQRDVPAPVRDHLVRRVQPLDRRVAQCRQLVPAGAGGGEPRVAGRGVVDDQVGDDPDAAPVRLRDQLVHVGQRAEARVDGGVVGDVVPVVTHRRGVERGHPQQVDAEPAQVVQPRGQAGQVAPAVAVRVGERRQVHLVADGLPPPVGCHDTPHRTVRKNARSSETNSAGSSSAAKWPPRAGSLQYRMSV